MPARFAILMLIAALFLQPLVSGSFVQDECCAVPDPLAPSLAASDEHECACCEIVKGADEPDPSDRDRNEQRPRGCDCPKSCCSSIVKVPLGVSPTCTAAERREPVDRVFSDAPERTSDARTSRLKRPPRAGAAV
ncbi:MAG: hypothetical protein KJZ54_07395 [Phycisphaerales bacterium]|nr:hypothetical protein [Phycisphaerales bacterium]